MTTQSTVGPAAGTTRPQGLLFLALRRLLKGRAGIETAKSHVISQASRA